jgi:hypothetical protein
MGSGSEKKRSHGLQGTTAVPLDGAARDSGRTRAPARGTAAVPPLLPPSAVRANCGRSRRSVFFRRRQR